MAKVSSPASRDGLVSNIIKPKHWNCNNLHTDDAEQLAWQALYIDVEQLTWQALYIGITAWSRD